jgi:hypothetical protein
MEAYLLRLSDTFADEVLMMTGPPASKSGAFFTNARCYDITQIDTE